MAEGKQPTAGDWQPDSTLWPTDAYRQTITRNQLCKPYVPQPSQTINWGDREPGKPWRAALGLVQVKWRDMPYADAVKYAREARQPLPAGAVVARYE